MIKNKMLWGTQGAVHTKEVHLVRNNNKKNTQAVKHEHNVFNQIYHNLCVTVESLAGIGCMSVLPKLHNEPDVKGSEQGTAQRS